MKLKKILIYGILLFLGFILGFYLENFIKQKDINKLKNDLIILKSNRSKIDDKIQNIKKEYKDTKEFNDCIKNGLSIDNCLNLIVLKKVKETDDLSKCKDLNKKDDQENCINQFYIEKAYKKNDIKICDKISFIQDKNFCKKQLIEKWSILNNNVKECDKIEYDVQKMYCKVDFYTRKALNDKNKNICKNILKLKNISQDKNYLKNSFNECISFIH